MKIVSAALAAVALLSMCLAAQASVTIETVAIGGVGNAADTRLMSDNTRGYGAVNYNYSIGKYEVTAGQYCEFLNAKAATDTYGLYSTSMWSDSTHGCQIQRSGSSGGYTYSVASDYASRPVNYVSWYDTLRFANWMTNGQGSGDTESGSYLVTGGGVNSGTVTIPNAALRATWSQGSTAKWLLASEDEWYKASYYKDGIYSLYANGTSAWPVIGADSNYNGVLGHTWDGGCNGALEQNGTKDMMGNVWEWNEASVSGSYRVLRGGSFYNDTFLGLPASMRYREYATIESSIFGFRVSEVAPVPEPSSMIALAGGLVALVGMRRRRA